MGFTLRRRQAAASFSDTVPAAFEVLQEMKQVGTVMQRIAQRQSAPAPAGEGGDEREQLRRSATSVGQALGLEVVHLMVDNLAHDARLLAPVQDAVRQLEPVLMRLALKDPRFFSDRQHPARALLEQMTQRSLAFRAETDPWLRGLHGSLRTEVADLVPQPHRRPDALCPRAADAGAALGIARSGRKRPTRDRAVQALLHAEHRKLLADTFAREFRHQHDLAQLPPEVVEFVCGPWGQVVAEARIPMATCRSTQGLPGGGGRPALEHSRGPSASPTSPRLSQLIPDLLARLRNGLKGIEYPAARSAAFFNALMALHEQALKPPPRLRKACQGAGADHPRAA